MAWVVLSPQMHQKSLHLKPLFGRQDFNFLHDLGNGHDAAWMALSPRMSSGFSG